MSGPASIPYHSTRGTVYYTPTDSLLGQTIRLPTPPCRPRARRPQSIHITRLPADFVPFDLRSQPPRSESKKDSRFRIELTKLASRESARRVLKTVLLPFSRPNSSGTLPASPSAASPTSSRSPETSHSVASSFSANTADSTPVISRRASAVTNLDGSVLAMPIPPVDLNGVATGPVMPMKIALDMEKPICSGNGVACYIKLAEPVIYLSGLDHDGTTRDSPSGANSSAILRGSLQLHITKSAKIKTITLKFKGRARTEWPEGIPPEKSRDFEESSFRNEIIPFFNAIYEGSESGYGTQCNYAFHDQSASSSVTNLTSNGSDPSSLCPQQSAFSLSLGNAPPRPNRLSSLSTLSSFSTLTSKEQKRLSLQSNQSRSFQKGDSQFGATPQQKGYKVFHPGVYNYSFELPIDNNSPETIKLQMASVTWTLEAIVERAGTFRPDLHGFKEIPVIRTPSEDSLELVEPISISRRWEDQLQYEIMISGKSFPLGSRIPIAFKLTPLAKVHIHKVKVYVSENIEYFTNDRKVTRREVTRKLLLIEKAAGKPLSKDYLGSEVKMLSGGEQSPEEQARRRERAEFRRARESQRRGDNPTPLPVHVDNILGDLDLGEEAYWTATEMEMNVQLPTCEMMERSQPKRLVPDCTWKCANVHHWIKIIMRISRADADDPAGKKRRHFEISIDSPLTILGCMATQANLALPQYSGLNADSQGQERTCGCPILSSKNTPSESYSQHDQETDGTSVSAPNAMPLLARPPQAHLSNHAAVQRPMHLVRAPSFNPPAFSNDDPPPPMPMQTPPPPFPQSPPNYDTVIGTPSVDGLQDYFTRYNNEYEYEEEDDDDTRAFSHGRVNVPHPRTPGGRIARSMDIEREFMLDAVGFNSALRLGNIRSPDSNATVPAT